MNTGYDDAEPDQNAALARDDHDGERIRVFCQNVRFGALRDGRWQEQASVITASGASVVLLQEMETIADPGDRDRVRDSLGGMELAWSLSVSPREQPPAPGHTAVAWDPAQWELITVDTYGSSRLMHSYCGVHLRRLGRPVTRRSELEDRMVEVPWVFISAHLTPHSCGWAAQEAQLLNSRVLRGGGLGLLGGDVNHFPELVRGRQARAAGVPDEPDPDWDRMPSHNRASRCLIRDHPDDPWVADETVGKKLRDGDLVDVARHLALTRRDPSYLAVTGRHGRVRVDQAHATAALINAVTGYARHDTASDHYGISVTIDPGNIDTGRLADYV